MLVIHGLEEAKLIKFENQNPQYEFDKDELILKVQRQGILLDSHSDIGSILILSAELLTKIKKTKDKSKQRKLV